MPAVLAKTEKDAVVNRFDSRVKVPLGNINAVCSPPHKRTSKQALNFSQVIHTHRNTLQWIKRMILLYKTILHLHFLRFFQHFPNI